MTLVITGGAGHLGVNLALALLADGHDVRVVDTRAPITALRSGAHWINADIRDAATVRRAFDGADTVYHLASIISIVGGLGGLVTSVNVDGARSVAETALAAGVRRLVHCSSIHAFDLRAAIGQVVDESSPRALDADLPAYDRSKAAGEEQVRRVVNRGLDAVCVNPTAMVGPIDEHPSRMGATLLALWRRRLPAIMDGGFDWVDVRDVVRALRVAADQGRTGESYLIPGHRLSLAALSELANAVPHSPLPLHVAPDWLLNGLAPMAAAVARRNRTGTSVLPTPEALHALRSFPIISRRKAATELGYEPRPMRETLADLHAFFLDTGQLKPSKRRTASG